MDNQINFVQAVLEMKNNMPAMLECLELQAKQQRKHYQELLKQGFTEEQALSLIKK